MIEYENYCVGCEVCYNCGRKTPVPVVLCDHCGDHIEDGDSCVKNDGYIYHADCFAEIQSFIFKAADYLASVSGEDY